MTAKQPTPQAISALLRRAGLERSQRIGTCYGAPILSEGYRVKASTFHPPAGVDVRYRVGDLVPRVRPSSRFPGGLGSDEEVFAYERQMLGRCAEAIRAAGWTVEDRRYKLVVVAGEG
jgi:hypothetical protein